MKKIPVMISIHSPVSIKIHSTENPNPSDNPDFIFFWKRRPICKCGLLCNMVDHHNKPAYYICHACGKMFKLLAAGADFSKTGKIERKAVYA